MPVSDISIHKDFYRIPLSDISTLYRMPILPVILTSPSPSVPKAVISGFYIQYIRLLSTSDGEVDCDAWNLILSFSTANKVQNYHQACGRINRAEVDVIWQTLLIVILLIEDWFDAGLQASVTNILHMECRTMWERLDVVIHWAGGVPGQNDAQIPQVSVTYSGGCATCHQHLSHIQVGV